MKKSIVLVVMLFSAMLAHAQNLKPVALKVFNSYSRAAAVNETSLFTPAEDDQQRNMALENVVTHATFLNFDKAMAQSLVTTQPDLLTLKLPVKNGQPIIVKLVRTNIFTPDFSVTTGSTNGKAFAYTGGVHYQGIMDGDNNSIAAISIFNDEVMGMISSPAIGNLVLGKIKNDANSIHIFYNDKDLSAQPGIDCSTAADTKPYTQSELTQPLNRSSMVNCIRLFWEVNYNIFTDKGSVTGAANYVTGLFNQSAIIYTNDGITVELSEVFVWDVVSPYTGTTSSAYLSQFQNYRNSINGDLGHLLGYGGGGGVAAGFSGICASNLNSSQCYSGINSSYSNVPTYSWSVMVVTHEQGHLMGSRHTHACVWNGNSTAIDGCGPAGGYAYEGSCTGAPIPSGGGTIMSYCHLNAVGINLSLGFGSQPIAVILNNYNNGACLTACIGTSCMPSPSMSTSSVTTSSASFNWTAVAGATGYNIRYRIVGAATWITATTSATTYSAPALTNGSNYEWQVQTICQTGNSIFSISTTFTTLPFVCNIPTGLSTTNVSSSGVTFNWTAVSGASNYTIQYRIVGAASWTTVTASSSPFGVFSLLSGSSYEWQIRTNCAGGSTSAFSASLNFNTSLPPCENSLNNYTTNISNAGATLNWTGGAGSTGVTYNLRYRIVGTATWSTATATPPAASLAITGLTANANYEWQIQTVCSQSASAFSSSVTFTTLCPAISTVVTAGGPTTFCQGSNVILNASTGSGYSYQWLLNSVIIPGEINSTFTANASGSYSVVISSGTCSVTSAATSVTVNALPAPSISGSTVFCAGASTTLNAGAGYSSYLWSTGATSTSIVVNTANTFTVTVTNANGCAGSASATTTIGTIVASITPAGPVSFCVGTNVTLTATSGSGYSYQWYRNNVLIAGVNQPSISVGDDGSFKCTVTSGSCTATTNTVVLTRIVNPTPVVTNATPISFCSPGSVVLTANTFTGVNYQWENNGVIIPGATSQTLTATSAGQYRVAQTANGCSRYSNKVGVTTATTPAVTITATGPTTLCAGGTVPLSITSPIPGYAYQWLKDGVAVPGATTTTFDAPVSGSYTCSATASCGTASSNAIPVSIGTFIAQVSPTGNVFICVGGSILLSASTGTGFTYQWQNNGVDITGATSPTYTANAPGSYSVSMTSPCGSGTSAATVVTQTSVTASITPANPITVCTGTNVYYTANAGSGYTYRWFKNNVFTGITSASYGTANDGSYKVEVSLNGACPVFSNTAVLTVINNPTPTITPSGPTSFCAGQSVTFASSSFSGVAYQWQKNGVDITGATLQNYTATASGWYRCQQTANGCSKFTPKLQVVVNCRIANNGNLEMTEEGIQNIELNVFPNPFEDKLNITITAPTDKQVVVQLFDVLGKLQHSQTAFTNTSTEINAHLPAGVYMLSTTINGNMKTVKAVKTK